MPARGRLRTHANRLAAYGPLHSGRSIALGSVAWEGVTPIGPNSVVAHWTDAQFIQTMHTGVTPEGRKLRGEWMPWQAVGTLSDDELRGLLMALKKGA